MMCLFEFRFNIKVNNFFVVEGWSHCFLGINKLSRELMCLAQLYNCVEPRFRGYKTFFMLYSAEHKIETAHKC